MATTSSTTSINTTSMFLTPQAVDDTYTILEGANLIQTFDVMSNDLGGNAKTLWSITSGTESTLSTAGIADLISQDTVNGVSVYESTSLGAQAKISGGKIVYDATALQTTIDGLGANEHLTDTITYAIRLGNGTLSLATMTVIIQGENDKVLITGYDNGEVSEGDDGTSQYDSGKVTYTDADIHDQHTLTISSAASHGTASVDQNGTWHYTVNNSGAVDELGAGVHLTDHFTVLVDDGHGGAAEQVIDIDIVGTNDAASISGDDSGAVTEDGDGDDTGTLTVSDVNSGEAHTQAVTAAAHNSDAGLGSYSVDSDGNWTYEVDNALVQYLGDGESATDTFTVTSLDSTASKLVTVTIHGANDTPEVLALSGDSAGTATPLPETNDGLSTSGTLTVRDADTSDTAAMTVFDVSATGNTGGLTTAALKSFMSVTSSSIAADATDLHNVSWAFDSGTQAFDFLAAGEELVLSYTIRATDDSGAGNNIGDGVVTIKISGTNDAPALTGTQAGLGGTEDTPYTVTPAALLQGYTDVDGGTLSISGYSVTDPGDGVSHLPVNSFTVPGEFTVALPQDYNGPLSLSYDILDGQGGSTHVTRTVTIAAVNDAPEATNLSAAESYTEDTPLNLTDIVAHDVDSSILTATLTLSNAAAGSLSTATAGATTSMFSGGVWTATGSAAEVNTLLAGVTFNPAANFNGNFDIATSVSDGSLAVTGSKAMTGIAVNDPAVISGDKSGTITEDAAAPNTPNTVSGDLNSIDVDGTNDLWSTTVATAPTHGTATINAAGQWTYTLNDGDSAVNALNNVDTLPDSFVVKTADGTAQTVNITINGHTDGLAPTDITFDAAASASALSLSGAGSLLGTFRAVDSDSSAWNFVLGGTNASAFALTNASNSAAATLSVGTNALAGGSTGQIYTIQITATDKSANSFSEGFTFHVGTTSGDHIAAMTAGTDIDFGFNNNDILSGGAGDDTLIGGNGSDTLYGGEGNDTLYGGQQTDHFMFEEHVNAVTNVDRIMDFDGAGGQSDKIHLLRAQYGIIGNANDTLASAEFASVTGGGIAAGSTAHIVYDTSNGNLYFDSDGAATAAGRTLFAVLLNGGTAATSVDNTDFLLL